MNNAQLINQTSGKVEYYTPAPIVQAARLVMGGIDLDPASSSIANETVKATKFYPMQGLILPWMGRVWMNHPFGRVENARWVNKLINSFELGFVTQACCITFACTSERWFRPLMQYPQCYLSPRTNYLTEDGKVFRGVTKGSVVTYLGNNIVGFYDAFRGLGNVMIPAAMGNK